MSKNSPPSDKSLQSQDILQRKNVNSSSYYFEFTINDAYQCFKALEFMATLFNKVVPISYSPNGMISNGQIVKLSAKIKKINGSIIRIYLEYNHRNLPDYGFFQDGDENVIRCVGDNDNEILSVGINVDTITEVLKSMKPTGANELFLFSKSNQPNLYYTYSNDKKSPQFTLKTAIGYVNQVLSLPLIYTNASNIDVNYFNNSHKMQQWISVDICNEYTIKPNFSSTVEQFMQLCGAFKQRQNADVTITIFTSGVHFKAEEYGSSGKEIFHSVGVCDKKLETIVTDALFFTRLHGTIDKFSDAKSIIHFYFGMNKDSPVITLTGKVGNSGFLLLQKEITLA